MSESDFVAALPVAGEANKSLLRDALVKRVIYPFFDGEDPTAWYANVNGAVPAAIANSSGGIFFYDENDSTTAHDGVVCIVTADGYRYKTSNMTMPDAVDGRDVDAPTGTEEIGAAYITSSAPDSVFASWPDSIVVLTIRDWLPIDPRIGRPIYVKGEKLHYFLDEDGVWRTVFLPEGGQVRDQALVGGQRRYIVQSQTLNTPPGSPAPGIYWIVGPSPVPGDWAGAGGKIATKYDGDSVWTLIDPKVGDEAYDVASGANFIWNGTIWRFAGGAWSAIEHIFTEGTGNTSAAGATFWNGTGTPISSNAKRIDDIGITATILQGKKFRISYCADLVISTTSPVTGTGIRGLMGVALFRDSELNAIAFRPFVGASWIGADSAWQLSYLEPCARGEFIITADDSAEHTYKVAIMSYSSVASGAASASSLARRDILLEVAA